MITVKDAIAVGKAVSRSVQGKVFVNDRERYAARGAGVDALNSIWYDVLPVGVRRKIGTLGTYYTMCAWPD